MRACARTKKPSLALAYTSHEPPPDRHSSALARRAAPKGLRLIARACGAALAGGEVGSTALALLPGDAQAAVDRRRELVADTGTAGSVTMLAQAVLPVLLYADAPAREGESEGEGIELRARLVGGTDVRSERDHRR